MQREGPRLKNEDPEASGKLAHVHTYTSRLRLFPTLGVTMMRGREFTLAEAAVGGVISAIIDEPLANRLFPGVSPLGRRLQFAADDDDVGSDRAVEIIGVVKGTRHDLFDRELQPHLYLPSG